MNELRKNMFELGQLRQVERSLLPNTTFNPDIIIIIIVTSINIIIVSIIITINIITIAVIIIISLSSLEIQSESFH